MEASHGTSNNTLMLMFGVPIVTTAVVCSSMYVGHLLTKRAYQRSGQSALQQPRQLSAAPAQRTVSPATAGAPAVAAVEPAVPVAPAPVAIEEKARTRDVTEVRLVPMSAPVVPSIPGTSAKPVSAASASAPETAKIEKIERVETIERAERVPAPAVPATRKPMVMKPPAVPTPLLVHAKEPTKSARTQRETKPYPQRVVQTEARAVSKTAAAPVAMAAPTSPAAVIVPLPPAPAPSQTVPAPAKPVVVAAPAPAEIETPKPNPIIIETPEPETNGEVAVAEPVRRAPVIAPVAAPAPITTPVQAATQPRPVAQPVAALPASTPAIPEERRDGRMILASTPAVLPVAAPAHKGLLLGRPIRDEDLSLDSLYALSKKYVEAYCVKQGKDPAAENQRWMKRWMENVEQALMDGASSEQQYINRVTISKRDCFNIEKATPEKIVEGCRILLRYRDGNFAWLSAMREALTRENLLKTLNFLNAGPQS